MNLSGETELTIRDQKISIEFTITEEPDESVGAGVGYTIDRIFDAADRQLYWSFTEREEYSVSEAINDWFWSYIQESP